MMSLKASSVNEATSTYVTRKSASARARPDVLRRMAANKTRRSGRDHHPEEPFLHVSGQPIAVNGQAVDARVGYPETEEFLKRRAWRVEHGVQKLVRPVRVQQAPPCPHLGSAMT